ncbi:hypothetical protein HPB49_009001 [Dermacentor silvarum]|uniref:Uncharacterized protein n=1 Tax=Dermacentor silvarum TaxID=543639 RepID=A0ACB8DBZ3_DERSI|nr:hypothetical protein HPB49_009001 [Dermacentor silvarum]
MPEATLLGLTAMEPPGKMGGRLRTATATVADSQVVYDRHSMIWTTVPSSDSRPELPKPFKSAALAAAFARREQASNAVTAASAKAQGKKQPPSWQPQPLPKPKATDFVVVLKPRTQLSLATVFPKNGADRALIPHLGATATRLVQSCDGAGLKSHFDLHLEPANSGQTCRALFGYLRADTQDSCYLVVTVHSFDTEPTLRESLYWPEGEILHVRRLGTFSKAKPRYVSYDALLIPVQPYKKTVPACGRCGSVGHRPDACPGPKPDICGICGKAVPLTDGAHAPHVCTPRTGAVRSAIIRRHPNHPLLHPSRPQEARTSTPTETEEDGPSGFTGEGSAPCHQLTTPPHPDAVVIGPSQRGPTPDGPPTRKSTVRTPSERLGRGSLSAPPHPSTIPHTKLPTPSTPTREQIVIRQLQAQVASLTQAVEALANRLPLPNPTSSGQAPEAMDSALSEHRDTTALLAPIEARASSLEAHVASIVTTIEDRLAAVLQTVVDRIPGSCPNTLSAPAAPNLNRYLIHKHPNHPPPGTSKVGTVDRQSEVSIATSDVSTGSSSGAPMDLSALLEALKFLAPTMAANGSRSPQGRAN